MYKFDNNKKINILKKHNNINIRIQKIKELKKNGIAFPNNFRKNYISKKLHIKYGKKNNKELKKLNIKVKIAGRLISIRIMGKISFATIKDAGGKIQLYVTQDNISILNYNLKFKKLDIGDIIGIDGILFKTTTGELSVNCKNIILLTKSIRSLPNKFHGLTDKEISYRKRYLDLITNENSYKKFKTRSKIIQQIRIFMHKNDFIEVETPMIHYIPGGAKAKPFITYYNSLNTNMYLRIAPELYLKQLIIGGFEKIFEINRNFRNEGISSKHNPEFSMMELYMAYCDYNDLMIFIEKLFSFIIIKVFKKKSLKLKYNNKIINFNLPFQKINMLEAICKYNNNISLKILNDYNLISILTKKMNLKINKNWGLGKIQNIIFEETTEKHIIQPTFITNYPTEVSPLAKQNDKNNFFSDRFEFFIHGFEIANGYSELNDSEEQINRFDKQNKNKDNKKILYDKDYITSLEYGLPPTAGLGIGIDRLIMILTNSLSIRDVILFPTLRHK